MLLSLGDCNATPRDFIKVVAGSAIGWPLAVSAQQGERLRLVGVDTGLVPNLARPGGNVTGFAAFQYSLAGKWLEILKEAIPGITRVALLFNPDTTPFAQKYIEELRISRTAFGVETQRRTGPRGR